ncbi:MAG: hypothetical protein QW279_08230 [Candidatus Jordarchaeaceae archaeon]
MAELSFFERLRHWGLIITSVSVIAFLVVFSIFLAFGLGINSMSILPIISFTLIGLAIVFVCGFAFELYGSIRLWLSKR